MLIAVIHSLYILVQAVFFVDKSGFFEKAQRNWGFLWKPSKPHVDWDLGSWVNCGQTYPQWGKLPDKRTVLKDKDFSYQQLWITLWIIFRDYRVIY